MTYMLNGAIIPIRKPAMNEFFGFKRSKGIAAKIADHANGNIKMKMYARIIDNAM